MSLIGAPFSPRMISGAMYERVPPRNVSRFGSMLESPKSTSLTIGSTLASSSHSSITLAGLMSRWIMPMPCR